jgi:hypothetical protein
MVPPFISPMFFLENIVNLLNYHCFFLFVILEIDAINYYRPLKLFHILYCNMLCPQKYIAINFSLSNLKRLLRNARMLTCLIYSYHFDFLLFLLFYYSYVHTRLRSFLFILSSYFSMNPDFHLISFFIPYHIGMLSMTFLPLKCLMCTKTHWISVLHCKKSKKIQTRTIPKLWGLLRFLNFPFWQIGVMYNCINH